MLKPDFVKIWLPNAEADNRLFDATEKMESTGALDNDAPVVTDQLLADIETVTARIEASQADITA